MMTDPKLNIPTSITIEKPSVDSDETSLPNTAQQKISVNAKVEVDKIDAEITSNVSEFEKLKLLYEFQYNAVKEAAAVLEKGVAFFLLIIGALTSYVISNKNEIDIELQRKLILGAVIVTSFVTICVSLMAWGIYTGLKNVKHTLKIATKSIWALTNADGFMKRGTYTSLIIGLFGTALMIIILSFYINIYISKGNEMKLLKQQNKQTLTSLKAP